MDEILIKSLAVLEDGKILTINNKNNKVVYLQPIIVVDSKEETQRLEVKGSEGNQVRVSTDIDTVDGVSFSGTFEQLETAIREAAKTANGLLSGGGSGGGGSVVVANNTDPSTATKQDEQTSLIAELEGNTKRKAVGSLIDLTADISSSWGGFPLEAASVTLLVNGDSLVFGMGDVESENNEDLAQQLNNVQTLVAFDYVKGEDKIVFNGVKVSNIEVEGLLIEDNNVGPLGYNNFTDSTDEDTGATQQLALLLQQQVQLLKDLNGKTPGLEPTISLSYTGSAPVNLTTSQDKDGKTVPTGRFADITIFATNNNVSYRFDGGTTFTPAKSYPRTRANFSTTLKKVNLDLFILAGEAGNSRVAISVNLHKQ